METSGPDHSWMVGAVLVLRHAAVSRVKVQTATMVVQRAAWVATTSQKRSM